MTTPFNLRLQLEHLLFDRPRDSRLPQDIVLRLLRYPYALLRDLLHGDLNLRATGLVYSTLMALVPLIAFSFAVLKGLGFHRDLEPFIYEFFRPLGDQATRLTDQVLGFVERVQGSVLGSLGLGFLIWTVISTIQKVEEAFNYIWHVNRPRSFARRFSEYVSVMVVAPILLVSALGLLAAVTSNSLVQRIAAIEPFGTTFVLLGKLGPYVLVTIVFTFVYTFIPNTRVRLKPAFIAGLLAAMAWVASGAMFGSLVAYSTRMMAIYAGFAIVLLTLFWLWLNWFILLLGAQLSFYLQHPAYMRRGQVDVQPTSRLRERLALSAMWLIGADFSKGEHRWRLNDLAQRFDVPGSALTPVVDALIHHGLLVETDKEVLVPARDPGSVKLEEILGAVRAGRPQDVGLLRKAHTVAEADAIADRMEAAVQVELNGLTLRDLLTERSPPEAPAPG